MRLGVWIVALLVSTGAVAFEMAFPNMVVPYLGMDEKSFELSLCHRFYGRAFEDEPFDTFFGMDAGANVAVGMRYFYSPQFDFELGHTRAGKQLRAGAGWNEALSGSLRSRVFAGYVSEEWSEEDGRHGGLVAGVTLSGYTLGGRARPVFSYFYDGIDERHGIGVGIEMAASPTVSLLGEYFPILDRDDEEPEGTVLPEDAWDAGIRLATPGHQFLFIVGNGHGIGSTDQLRGTMDNDLYLGFSIRRLFSV
ncbi:hypothetical protein JW921_08340 [Candidatus Fermentibacterales bacterium]|nr:hypothetical protein [Candidatus Fermentibacterales bacterium]